MARPKFCSTEEQQRQVKMLAALGMNHEDIAQVLEISPKTLRKHFRRELTRGDIEARTRIARNLMQSGDSGNVPAQIFLAKARLGWREHAPLPSSPTSTAPEFVVTITPATGGKKGK
jgi:DNA-binding CsgD family transcriptional regulator